MSFNYSCFVSYRHHEQSALAERFIVELERALRNEVSVLLDEEIYLDRQRLKGGYLFNSALQRALCRSVCMIVVYTPTYFSRQHPYCAREYRAMVQLEAQRFARLERAPRPDAGLIIPIVLRGASTLPAEIRDHRQYYNFEPFALTSRDLARNPRFAGTIREIADEIFKRKQLFDAAGVDLCAGCDDFGFPSEQETLAWLDTLRPLAVPFPLRATA